MRSNHSFNRKKWVDSHVGRPQSNLPAHWNMKSLTLSLVVVSVLFALHARAQEATRSSLPQEHPLVGTWRIDFRDLKCFEEYEVRADGTKLSRSGEERNESEHSITLLPSLKGFYKWTDKITMNNGRPDCSGSLTELGHVAVNYIRLHPSKQRFLLCEAEDLKSCFAEFYRKAQ